MFELRPLGPRISRAQELELELACADLVMNVHKVEVEILTEKADIYDEDMPPKEYEEYICNLKKLYSEFWLELFAMKKKAQTLVRLGRHAEAMACIKIYDENLEELEFIASCIPTESSV
jgi:hypothetical protein